MSTTSEWNEFFLNMLERAFDEFRRTDYYIAMKENITFHENLCKNDFTEREFVNIEHWIDKIYETNSAQSEFMYERGYQDCVSLLRRLGVI